MQAHLGSWEPKHEHNIAGVCYMLACACACDLYQDRG